MSEVNLRIDPSFSRRVKEVGNERKRVSVFLGDLVETTEIDTESE
jgi:hypothetical protein